MWFGRCAVTAAVLLAAAAGTAMAQPVSSAITYQGQLKSGGSPTDGNVAMVFRLFDAPTGGNQVGPTLTFDGLGGNPPPVSVTGGLFTVGLDFEAAAYDGQERWLEIVVQGTPLTPRQRLAATPYARYAARAGAPWFPATAMSRSKIRPGASASAPTTPLRNCTCRTASCSWETRRTARTGFSAI